MIAIICIILFLGGFAWPPLWLALLGYIIYIWKTSKQRRSDTIQNHLEKMIQGRRMQADVRNLYFEAAQAFAEERGGRVFPEDRDTISCTVVISGQPYSLTFIRERRIGGTHIRIEKHISINHDTYEDFEKSDREFRQEMMNRIKNSTNIRN
ncbi:hypothetical protein OSJ57_16315 [Sphingomonas sp. HH69]